MQVYQVNQLLKKYSETRKMVKKMMAGMQDMPSRKGKKGKKGKRGGKMRRGILPGGMSLSDLRQIQDMLDQ